MILEQPNGMRVDIGRCIGLQAKNIASAPIAILRGEVGVQVIVELYYVTISYVSDGCELKSEAAQQLDGFVAIERGMEDELEAAMQPGVGDGGPHQLNRDARVALPGRCHTQTAKVRNPFPIFGDCDHPDDGATRFRDPEMILRPLEIRRGNVVQIDRVLKRVDTAGEDTRMIQP